MGRLFLYSPLTVYKSRHSFLADFTIQRQNVLTRYETNVKCKQGSSGRQLSSTNEQEKKLKQCQRRKT